MLYDVSGKPTTMQDGDMIQIVYQENNTVSANVIRNKSLLNLGAPFKNHGLIVQANPASITNIMNLVGTLCGLMVEEVSGGFVFHKAKDPTYT